MNAFSNHACLLSLRQLVLLFTILLAGCSSASQSIKGAPQELSKSDQATVKAVLSQPRRIAVLIGINKFDDPEWNTLRYAEKDAQDLARVLRDSRHGSFDRVIVLTGPEETTRGRILTALRELSHMNLSKKDTVVFYISSHGTLTRTTSGRLQQYIVARDTRFNNILDTGINVAELRRIFTQMRSRKKVMIFAFCHSGKGKSKLSNSMREELTSLKSPFFVKPLENTSEASIVLAASAWGETAREDKYLRNDIYTHFLIEGIKKHDRNEDGAVTVSEAHDYAKEQTYYLTKGKQRPSMESVILGTDPIILSGRIDRQGKPVVYDYSRRYENMVIYVDGEAKGRLPLGVAVEPGSHRIELAANEDSEPLFMETVRLGTGEDASLPILLQGYDNGASIRIGYQGFFTKKVDRSIAKPMPMLGLTYTHHALFDTRFGVRADIAYGGDEQTLDIGPVRTKADVSQIDLGVALLYRSAIGNTAWYSGPRIGGVYLTRDASTPGISNQSDGSFTAGTVAGLNFRYKKHFSLAIEGAVNYANIEISNSNIDSFYYNLFGSLSYNF